MGTDYRLACINCKKYLDLHKWCPDEEMRVVDPCSLKYKTYCGNKTSSTNILDAIYTVNSKIIKEASGHWIEELIPFVETFCVEHRDHEIIIFNDCGRMPWYPDEPLWYEWQEIFSRMSCIDTNATDVDLPKNIIFDLKIRTWKDAYAHYIKNCPDVENPKELETIFRGYLNEFLSNEKT